METPTPRDCREEFKPAAERYQKGSRLIAWLGWTAVACLPLALVPYVRGTAVAGFVVCVLACMVGRLVLLGAFKCPACKKSLEESPGAYCPECGKVSSDKSHFFRGIEPRCSDCTGRVPRPRDDRDYTIRYCQHCGSHVHDRGL